MNLMFLYRRLSRKGVNRDLHKMDTISEIS